MRVVLCVVCALVAAAQAAPMPQTTQIVNGINERIRMLRLYCPQLFQVLDNVIQNVTSTAFRVIGRVVLQSGALGIGGGGGGGGGGGSNSSGGGGGGGGGGGRVSVVLPTFGPDEDEDYEEAEDVIEEAHSNAIPRPEAASSTEASTTSTSASTTTTTTTASTTSTTTTTIGSPTEEVDVRVHDADHDVTNELSLDAQEPLFTSPASAARIKRETPEEAIVRLIRAAEDTGEARDRNSDQESAASGGNSISPADDLANVQVDDADRDKRLVPFGGSFDASASGGGAGGSAGGSGNFLFDIIRSTADGAARAAGTVYRMIAGTEGHLGLAATASASSTRSVLPQFVAGSGNTEESDEKENAPAGPGGVAEIDIAKGADSGGEGIPGPITRLFVLANRGIANLIQDIILRIASTSERIVNFKARLITSLI